MKSFAALALTLSAVTDATSLRARVKTLSGSQLAQVHALAAKYDCRSAKGDLVETINSIIVKNNEEAVALKAECERFNDANKQAWADATALYDAQSIAIPIEENELEHKKVFGADGANKVFESAASDWCVAEFMSTNTEYSCATYGTKVLPSKLEKDAADDAAESAKGEYDSASAAHQQLELVQATAQKEYIAEVVRRKNVVDTERDAELAAATLRTEQTLRTGKLAEDGTTVITKSATTVQTEEKAECTRLYNLRSTHISSDSKLLDDIKPLLAQLKLCDTDGTAQADEKNTKLLSLLETSAQAKCALANKQLQSFLEVSAVPSGTYEEFRNRVVTEKATMEAEKLNCDKVADDIFAKAKHDADALEKDTHARAEAAHEKSHKDYEEAQRVYILNLNDNLENSRVACCDHESKTSKKYIKDQAVIEQARKESAFTALQVSGQTQMTLAYDAKQKTITDARRHKEDNIGIFDASGNLLGPKGTRMQILENEKANAKSAINQEAAVHQTYCTESTSDLVLEADTIAKMQSLLNTGGQDGSGVRIVGQDRHSGDNFSPLNDEAVNTEAGAVAFDASDTAKNSNFDFVKDMDQATGKCMSDPCENGATCKDEESTGDYYCSCTAGFDGKNCETDTSKCRTSDPCENGATCEDVESTGDYTCSCSAGFEGKNCDTCSPPTGIPTVWASQATRVRNNWGTATDGWMDRDYHLTDLGVFTQQNFDFNVESSVGNRNVAHKVTVPFDATVVIVSEKSRPMAGAVPCPETWRTTDVGSHVHHGQEGVRGFVQYNLHGHSTLAARTYDMTFCKMIDVAKGTVVTSAKNLEKSLTFIRSQCGTVTV